MADRHGQGGDMRLCQAPITGFLRTCTGESVGMKSWDGGRLDANTRITVKELIMKEVHWIVIFCM